MRITVRQAISKHLLQHVASISSSEAVIRYVRRDMVSELVNGIGDKFANEIKRISANDPYIDKYELQLFCFTNGQMEDLLSLIKEKIKRKEEIDEHFYLEVMDILINGNNENVELGEK